MLGLDRLLADCLKHYWLADWLALGWFVAGWLAGSLRAHDMLPSLAGSWRSFMTTRLNYWLLDGSRDGWLEGVNRSMDKWMAL